MNKHIIVTYSNTHFDYSSPLPSMINISDIVRGLAHTSRFAGQTDRIYTVAQHCVECSYLVPETFALEALLHDASEAYCNDIPSPLKSLLPDYKTVEKRIDRAIRLAFDLPLKESDEVKKADVQSLKNEMNCLGVSAGYSNPELDAIMPNVDDITILEPEDAFYAFKKRFIQIICRDDRYVYSINGNTLGPHYWRNMSLDFVY